MLVKTSRIVAFVAGAAAVALGAVALCGCEEQAVSNEPAAESTPAEMAVNAPAAPMSRDERTAWWRDARFGMFIHWGLYAVPAGTYDGKRIGGIGEWIMETADIPVAEYEKFATQFNPVQFDADQWVRIAKDAGMKYIVITSKHHDGFCLWDSKVTQWDIMDASPFKRDILKELTAACRKHGLRMCFYHSIMDWHHPDAQAPFYPAYNNGGMSNPNFDRYVRTYLWPQLAELVHNYGPLGVLWFDGEWIRDWSDDYGQQTYQRLIEMQPDLIINNRVGKGRGGMSGMSRQGSFAGDFGTPEQEIPARGLPGTDWETCMTMNDTWGYKSYDENWKSTEDLLRKLADIASKGGNFLLNVGPTSEGLIPAASVERLAGMGRWMAANGESIYGTTASPLGALPFGRCTARPGKLYLHVFDWPKDGELVVEQIKNEVTKAYLLADGTALEVRRDGLTTTITVPAGAPDPINTVVVLEIVGEPKVVDIQAAQDADGAVLLRAAVAKIDGDRAQYESGGAKDNIGFWTSAEDNVSWNFTIDRPGVFEIEVTQACEGDGGSAYVVSVAGQDSEATVKGTGNWDRYVTEKIGAVKLDAAGEYTLKVVPGKLVGSALMNLRSVRLVPVK